MHITYTVQLQEKLPEAELLAGSVHTMHLRFQQNVPKCLEDSSTHLHSRQQVQNPPSARQNKLVRQRRATYRKDSENNCLFTAKETRRLLRKLAIIREMPDKSHVEMARMCFSGEVEIQKGKRSNQVKALLFEDKSPQRLPLTPRCMIPITSRMS